MDSRTRLALGGMATVAASVAVVASVAMTTSFALVDSAGAPVDARPVVVPSASSTPVRTPEPVDATTAPAPAAPVVVAELVPAPAPDVVVSPSDLQSSATEPSEAAQEQLVAEVETSGTWDAVYAWAEERGWSRGRIEALILRLEADVEKDRVKEDTADLTVESTDTGDKNRRIQEGTAELAAEPSDIGDEMVRIPGGTDDLTSEPSETEDEKNPESSAEKEKKSGRDQSGPSSGSKREQLRVPPS